MTEPVPPTEETPGQHCARWLKAAKLKARETNTVVGWDQVANIIDSTLTGLAHFKKAPQIDSKALSSEFGDRRKVPPTPAQVTAYCASIGLQITGDEFCDFYLSKGWVIGKGKMKDWQAACRTWGRDGRRRKPTVNSTSRDYTKL